LLIFKVTVPFQKLNLVSLTQASVLPVSPFDSRMPTFFLIMEFLYQSGLIFEPVSCRHILRGQAVATP
jgi:hypothetical protein